MEELKVIFEDNHIIVVIKPQNMPCCPDDSGDFDLLTQVKGYLSQRKTPVAIATPPLEKGEFSSAGVTPLGLSSAGVIPFSDSACEIPPFPKGVPVGRGFSCFCGLVHRLDRVTGGVMVYAKTSKSASRLAEQLKNRTMDKKYLAVVLGEPRHREQTLVNYLLKNERTNTVMVVPSATNDAKRAELQYKLLKTAKDGKVSLVEVNLITGRSHQIRVQMANIGHPVFGDAKYGGDRLGRGWNLALWAYEMRFLHPTTGDVMKFVVNPPEDVPWTSFEFDRKPRKYSDASDGGGVV